MSEVRIKMQAVLGYLLIMVLLGSAFSFIESVGQETNSGDGENNGDGDGENNGDGEVDTLIANPSLLNQEEVSQQNGAVLCLPDPDRGTPCPLPKASSNANLLGGTQQGRMLIPSSPTPPPQASPNANLPGGTQRGLTPLLPGPPPTPPVQPTPPTPPVQPTPLTPPVQPTPLTPPVQPTPLTPILSPTPEANTEITAKNLCTPMQQGAGEEATLTIKKIFADREKLIPGTLFMITPNPYTLNGSLLVKDNESNKFDCNPDYGIILLRNLQYSYYTIQEVQAADRSIIHQAELAVHESMPDPVINFVERNLTASEKMSQIIPNQYIVVLNENNLEDPNSIADHYSKRGIKILHIYDSVFKGLAINVKDQNLFREIQNDPRVSFIGQDIMGHITSVEGIDNNMRKGLEQSIPTGINRIDADLKMLVDRGLLAFFAAENSNQENNNRSGKGILQDLSIKEDVDIAILDTGISLTHPDLNVYKNVTFVNGTNSGDDDQGHGSHVAGIAASKDNPLGTIGVAPGARLWSIKVCDNLGGCPLSSIIHGIEYITEHADEIDVANISIVYPPSPLLDQAINKSIAAGVIYVTAVGNDGKDASSYAPANNPSVISVSAIGDSDGKCGGLGRTLKQFDGNVTDDTLAYFSNFGSTVDIAAPGVDILSTYNGTEYAVESGTSMAAPHVAGAAALYKARNPSASPQEVFQALITSASLPTVKCDGNGHGYFQGDADNFNEPLLYVN